MKEYIVSILYIAIFGIILELILPAKSKIKKYVMGVLALLVIITVISPITNILKTGSVEQTIQNVTEVLSKNIDKANIANPTYDFSKYSITSITDSTKHKIEESIKNELDEGTEKVDVTLKEDYTLEEIKIYIKPQKKLLGNLRVSQIIQKVSDKFNIEQSKIKIIER